MAQDSRQYRSEAAQHPGQKGRAIVPECDWNKQARNAEAAKCGSKPGRFSKLAEEVQAGNCAEMLLKYAGQGSSGRRLYRRRFLGRRSRCGRRFGRSVFFAARSAQFLERKSAHVNSWCRLACADWLVQVLAVQEGGLAHQLGVRGSSGLQGLCLSAKTEAQVSDRVALTRFMCRSQSQSACPFLTQCAIRSRIVRNSRSKGPASAEQQIMPRSHCDMLPLTSTVSDVTRKCTRLPAAGRPTVLTHENQSKRRRGKH